MLASTDLLSIPKHLARGLCLPCPSLAPIKKNHCLTSLDIVDVIASRVEDSE